MITLIVALGLFFVFIAFGLPVFAGLLAGAGIGIFLERGFSGIFGLFPSGLHSIAATYTLAVVPMFILVGTLSEAAGLGTRAYKSFHTLFGHISGGVLIATTFAAAAFGACSGSTVAAAALFSKIAWPELKKLGYPASTSLAGIAVGGTLATIIPPSVMMVIYGMVSGTSVGRLLVAGIIPGIMIAIALALTQYIMVKINPKYAGKRVEPAPWNERLKTPLNLWPLMAVFVIIMGSIISGLVTPSESGALGVVVVLIWNIMKKAPARDYVRALREAAIITCQIMLLVVGGLMFSKVVAYSGVTTSVVDWIVATNQSLTSIWVIIIIIWTALGMMLDSTSQLVLTIPLFFPIMTGLGVDPLALGVISIIMIEVGVITPPVGFNCFVVASIADTDSTTVFKGIVPFYFVLMVCVVLIIVFPFFATWLPTLVFG